MMREKLLNLMQSEGLKPSQLAELLGVNPAGISHILSGRNKPGFDLLQKILKRFPQINPDWLLLDSDKMYRDEQVTSHSTHMESEELLPGELQLEPQTGKEQEQNIDNHQGDKESLLGNLIGASSHPAVKRIVILYENGTFETFSPQHLR